MNSEAEKLAARAQSASARLALLRTEAKDRALAAMAKALMVHKNKILKANKKDLAFARKNGLSAAWVGRLMLDEKKLKAIAASLILISKLKDPVGKVISQTRRPNGLSIRKVRVPLGVIMIIYESRPNVTADCMALCLKSGNSVILKGGSEAFHSNHAIFSVLNRAALASGIPTGAFELVGASGRQTVKSLLKMDDKIQLVIPRGGESLIREVAKRSRIPVIKHTKGVCHVFVDKKADLEKAKMIVLNAKTQNPGVCNAMETLLVHRQVAGRFLPEIGRALSQKNVEIRGDAATRRLVSGAKKATEKDWAEEYLDLILSVRVVKDLASAVEHIRKYGSSHSDAIVTEDEKAAASFADEVDSACVFLNCSTRFNDGGEFGMGAEIGISTDKLHARGPMGLEELTSYKYVVTGSGQIRK